MKKKFSSMGRVAIALVLALSLVLVMGAPVSASPDVSDVRVELSNYTADAESNYYIYFTPGVDLAEDVDTITILFPAGTTVIDGITDDVDADLLVDEDGDAIWSADAATQAASEVAGYRVVVTTPVDIAAGTEARIDIIASGIKNPATDDSYQVAVWTSQETTHVDSASYTIGATSVTATGFGPSTEVTDLPGDPGTDPELAVGTAGLTDSYLVTFTGSNTDVLAADWGTITITFPPTTTVPGSISADSVYVSPTGVAGTFSVCEEDPVVSGRSVTVKTPAQIAAAGTAAVYFTVDAGIKNPTCSTDSNNVDDPEAYAGKVYTSVDTGSQRIVFDATVGVINAAPVSGLTFDPDSADSVVVDKAIDDYTTTADDVNIWSIDTYGNMADVPVDVVIDLASSSATGTFDDRSMSVPDEDFDEEEVTIQEIDDDDWLGTFWYRDTTAGTATITASYGTWTPVTWDMEVVEAEVHVVELYDGEVLIGTYEEIQLAIDDALTGNTVQVGPGTYTLAEGGSLTIEVAELTLESTDGAAVTIIDASSLVATDPVITINDGTDDVTVNGLTIKAGQYGIWCRGDDAIIQNNVVEVATWGSSRSGIDVASSATGANISGNELNEYAPMVVHGSDCTLSGNIFGSVLWFWPDSGQTLEGVTISDNIFPANTDYGAIDLMAAGDPSVIEDSLIEGNTISNRKYGIWIGSLNPADLTVTNLVITGNDITDNDGVGIKVDTWTAANDAIKFNTISGNTDYGVQNASGEAVDGTHNWWGTTVASEIADMVVTGAGLTCEPWLLASVSAGEWATSATSLDAQATVGVKVSGAAGTDQKIGAARYTENPLAAPEFTPLEDGFFDVYVEGATDTTEIGIKFYDAALTSDSVVYVWDAFEEVWAECSDQAYNATYGYIWVKVRTSEATVPTVPLISELTGTPFAISGEAAVEDISAYYRGQSGDTEVVETSDLLNAANDWANAVVPSGFTESISTTELLALANEWAAN